MLAWAELARKAMDNPNDKLLCPNDDKVLEVKVIDHPQHAKIEVFLKCSKCKTERTITFDKNDIPPMKVSR